MRALIVADVHSNIEAFRAVLADTGANGGFDVVWSLGDLVGYGPDPGECIALLRSQPHVAVAGNHDYAVSGVMGTEAFNPFAAAAARWTAKRLTAEEKAWLAALPAVQAEGDFTLTHGSLRDPVWEYLITPEAARVQLERQTTPYGLVGHTHIPLVFHESRSSLRVQRPGHGESVSLEGKRLVANPGGVGQPRDGDPRAAYAVADTASGRLEYRRVAYDVAATQAKMLAAGLPEYLAARLSRGR